MSSCLNDFFFCIFINNDAEQNAQNAENGIKQSVNADIGGVGVENVLRDNRGEQVYKCRSKGINYALY